MIGIKDGVSTTEATISLSRPTIQRREREPYQPVVLLARRVTSTWKGEELLPSLGVPSCPPGLAFAQHVMADARETRTDGHAVIQETSSALLERFLTPSDVLVRKKRSPAGRQKHGSVSARAWRAPSLLCQLNYHIPSRRNRLPSPREG